MITRQKVSDHDFLSASYRRLEDWTGLSYTHWARWFAGVSSPRLTTLERVANELGFGLPEFVALFEKRRSLVMGARNPIE